MNCFKINVLAVAAILGLSSWLPAGAQDESIRSTPAPSASSVSLPSANRLVADIARAESSNNAGDLILAYGQAVREPQLAKGALSALIGDFYRLRSLAGSAVQASQAVDETALRLSIFQTAQNQIHIQQNQQAMEQNQKIIEQNETLIRQNERVIALLDLLARKK